MPIVKAKQNTLLKRSPVDSSQLSDRDKFPIQSGSTIACTIRPSIGDSLEIKLAGNAGLLRSGEIWYIYRPHWNIADNVISAALNTIAPKPKEVKLDVPYFNQRDNWDLQAQFGSPDRQCNTSSNAMLAAYLLGRGHTFESEYGRMVARFGDTIDHGAQTKALREFGIESYWTTTKSPSEMMRSLDLNIPVVTGYLFKNSGHICIVTGYTTDGFFTHDPFGARNGSSDSYAIRNGEGGRIDHGKHDFYSNSVMGALVWESNAPRSNDPDTGWCRVVTSVNGRSTGLEIGV